MLNRVEIRDFQSIPAANIPLGGVTVITGPTGSGKSALFRAMLLLARNGRGVDRYIRAKHKSLSASVLGDGWAVRLTRSGPRGKNAYELLTQGEDGWTPRKFTKLDGKVPGEIAAVLKLTELNFSRQGAAAFLLDVPGTEVARQLGTLTNVALVLGAAQEAGRLRKRLVHDLEGAQARREALLEEAQEFAGLNGQRAAIAVAEAVLDRLEQLAARCARLGELTCALELAGQVHANATRIAALHEPPPMTRLEELAARCARLEGLAGELWSWERLVTRSEDEANAAAEEEAAAGTALHAALVAAGQCPTCGQAVS